jgi:hypothetical protein
MLCFFSELRKYYLPIKNLNAPTQNKFNILMTTNNEYLIQQFILHYALEKRKIYIEYIFDDTQ